MDVSNPSFKLESKMNGRWLSSVERITMWMVYRTKIQNIYNLQSRLNIYKALISKLSTNPTN